LELQGKRSTRWKRPQNANGQMYVASHFFYPGIY
jgi:hypothetical protein